MAWSPEGDRLIYAVGSQRPGADSDLYQLNMQTQHSTRLTNGGKNFDPAWSPDGRWVAYKKVYDRDAEPIFSLHFLRLDDACDIEAKQLDFIDSPSWSPDSEKLVFVGPRGIYEMDLKAFFGQELEALCPENPGG
jgi:Tol biopolymer transport system component